VDVSERVAEAMRSTIGVRPDVELIPLGGLPRTDRKTRRVIDQRQA